jgi:hypothetical protein
MERMIGRHVSLVEAATILQIIGREALSRVWVGFLSVSVSMVIIRSVKTV